MPEALSRAAWVGGIEPSPRRRAPRAVEKTSRFGALTSSVGRHGKNFALAGVGLLTCGVLANALFMQSEKHPAPYFSARQTAQTQTQAPAARPSPATASATVAAPVTAAMLTPVPQPRPAELVRAREAAPAVEKPAAQARTAPARPAPRETGAPPMQLASAPANLPETAPSRRRDFDAIGALISTGRTAAPVPPASIPNVPTQASGRILAVQQALAKLGYGVSLDGVAGSRTRQAIEAFEKSRNMPVTGQMSAKLTRELTARSGVKIP